MVQIENWERWRSREDKSEVVEKAWTHRVLRNLYRDAEEEFSVLLRDMWEGDDEYDRWEVQINSPTIDSAGSFRTKKFENKKDAEDFAVRWLSNHPLEDQLGYMTINGSPERDEFMEEELDMFESKGIDSRIRFDDDADAYRLEVDTEDFIDAGMRLG